MSSVRDRCDRLRWRARVTALLIMLSSAGAALAIPRPGPGASVKEELAILQAVVRHERPASQICVDPKLWPQSRLYVDSLTDVRDPNARPGYLREARRHALATSASSQHPLPIGDTQALALFPGARHVHEGECGVTLIVFRPVIVRNWAFLRTSRGDGCSSETRRVALSRSKNAWEVRHAETEWIQRGLPMCHDWRRKSPPSKDGHYILTPTNGLMVGRHGPR